MNIFTLSESSQNSLVGLGSIGKTSSARESLTIDTHHLLTLSDKLDTLPPNPTSFEPLPNSLVPQKNSQKPTSYFYFSKKIAALRRPALKLHCDRHYRARLCLEECGECLAMYFTWCWSDPHHTFPSTSVRDIIKLKTSTSKKNSQLIGSKKNG